MRLLKTFFLALLVVAFAACTSKTEPKENIDTKKTTTEEPALVKKNNSTKVKTASARAGSGATAANGSAKVNWIPINDLEGAMKNEKRKVMVDLYTSWCGWCKRMDKATFQNPAIADQLNDKFYAVKFDAEDKSTINFKGENHDFVPAGRKGYNKLAYKFANGRMSYPTIAFLDENLNRIDSYPGFKQPQQFDPLLKFIDGGHYKQQSLAEFSQGFKSNVISMPSNSQVQLTRRSGQKTQVGKVQPNQVKAGN